MKIYKRGFSPVCILFFLFFGFSNINAQNYVSVEDAMVILKNYSGSQENVIAGDYNNVQSAASVNYQTGASDQANTASTVKHAKYKYLDLRETVTFMTSLQSHGTVLEAFQSFDLTYVQPLYQQVGQTPKAQIYLDKRLAFVTLAKELLSL